MTTPPENRQFRRIPIAFQVKLVADDRIIAFPTAINVSMGGILLEGRDLLPVGSQCGVAILLANGDAKRRVVARGTVVRNDDLGMAITFSKTLDAGSAASLRTLIQSLEQGEPIGLDPADAGSIQKPWSE